MHFQVKKHFKKQPHFQTQLVNILYMFFATHKFQSQFLLNTYPNQTNCIFLNLSFFFKP